MRTFAYFLDRSARDRPWVDGCDVVLAGFLESGRPALAKVRARSTRPTEAHVYTHRTYGSLIVMAGERAAKRQVLAVLRPAFAQDPDLWPNRVASAIWYLGQHAGLPSIGGGVAVGVCSLEGRLYWPFVRLDERVFWRGLDVTESVAAIPDVEVTSLAYDEDWHAPPPRRLGTPSRPLPVRPRSCGADLPADRGSGALDHDDPAAR